MTRTLTFEHRPGAVYARKVHRGVNEVVVYPLLFGAARLGIGPADCRIGMDAVWDYDSVEEAVDAAHAWDGYGDPPGGGKVRYGSA